LGSLWLSHVAGHAEGNLSASLAIPWLAPGVGILLLLRYGRGTWPAIVAGSVVVWGVIRSIYLPMVIAESFAEALSIVLIVTLLHRWQFHPTLDRYKDSLLLLGALVLGRSVSSIGDVLAVIGSAWFATDPAVIGRIADAGAVRHGDMLVISSELLRFSSRWWANTAAGSLLVVPLLALGSLTLSKLRRDLAHLACLAIGVAAWIAAALTLPPGGVWLVVLLPAAYSLVAWATIRFGVGVAMSAVLIIALAASSGFGFQLGTFAATGPHQSLEAAWGFIGLLVATSLFLTALLSQRARDLRIIAVSAERYRQLFIGSPYPMWTEDAVSGQILLANPAALQTYGYTEQEFLRLRDRDLTVDPPAAWTVPQGGAVSVERHRTRGGSEIDVEVARSAASFDAIPVRICCVEELTERNELRLAVMRTTDIERFRLGEVIERQLMPLLDALSQAALRLGEGRLDELSERFTLLSISADAQSAAQICTRLTRGVSPLQWADGNLSEALIRLPSTLPKQGPQLRVYIAPGSELALSLERCDHVYRLAEEAVQIAAAHAGTGNMWLTLEVTEERVRVMIEDDGAGPVNEDFDSDLALQSINARAAAAEGQLEIGRTWSGGWLISFECAQTRTVRAATAPRPAVRSADAASAKPIVPAKTATPVAPAALPPAMHAIEPDQFIGSPPRPRWWLGAVLIALGAALTWLMSRYLYTPDPANEWYQSLVPLPWIPVGLAVATLLLAGERLWIALFGVALLLDLWFAPGGWQLQVLDAAAGTFAAVCTARLLTAMGFRTACERLRDLAALTGAAAVGQMAYVTLLPMGILLIGKLAPGALTPELRALIHAFDAPSGAFLTLAQEMFRWWVAGVTGILLGLPAVVAWSTAAWRRVLAGKLEMFLWVISLSAALLILFKASGADWRLPVLAACLAVAVWAAVRFGAALAWTATVLVALAASVSYSLKLGALAPDRSDWGVTALWAFVTLIAATAGTLTALLADSEQTEQRLRRLDARYRTLFDAVSHPLFAVAADGHIRLANDKAREFYGYTNEEFAAMSLADLEVEGDGQLPDLHSAAVVARRHANKSARSRDVELALTPVEFEDGPGALCFSIDVTERNRLRTQMIESADQEQRRLALEFHDGLGQILTGLQLGIQPLLNSARKHLAVDRAAIEFVSDAAREALAACTRILRGISPLQESGGDLLTALRRLPDHLPPGTRHQLTVSVSATSAVTLPLELREHLYQIAREATNNAIKHATANRISVLLSVTPNLIELCVEDDGIGFDPTDHNMGLGLHSLRLRAAALSGRLRITRKGAHGMAIELRCAQAVAA
jgi:PAS domain S-box-containing protein